MFDGRSDNLVDLVFRIFFFQGTASVETFGHALDVFDPLSCEFAVVLRGHQELDGLIVA